MTSITKAFSTPSIVLSQPETGCFQEFICKEVSKACFQTASYFTDPLCKGHEFFRRLHILETMHPTASKMTNFARKTLLLVGIFGCISLAAVTTPMGIALRYAGLQTQLTPFIYLQADKKDKVLPLEKSFSLLSWNICCIGGGYPISDGGVTPWSMRIQSVVERILEKNADVNCLYEVFDVQTAYILYEAMKEKGYTHFYFNMGAKPIGTSSGIFVASKYKIAHPEFIPFSQDMLVGRTKHAGKGAFAFDIESEGKPFATIVTTHMQHSELPEFPTDEEVNARKMQMELILKKVENTYNRCVVVTGDLNLDDDEYNGSFWERYFQKGDTFPFSEKTWDGDHFCATLVGKKPSGPLSLDHTMLRKGSAHSIYTDLVKTGFDAKIFKKEALSDHAGLISQIRLKH